LGRHARLVARLSAETEAAIAYFESADFQTDTLNASTYRIAFQPMHKLIGKLVREPSAQTLVEDFCYSSMALQLLPLTAGDDLQRPATAAVALYDAPCRSRNQSRATAWSPFVTTSANILCSLPPDVSLTAGAPAAAGWPDPRT
jgi:hypothetical protein